jgi:predicted transcriptional regulator of viral defense system
MRPDIAHLPELAVFTTREYALTAAISMPAASRQLSRLRQENRSFVQLTRGVWANTAHPHFSTSSCVSVLLGNEQGYISFLGALHMHGALSQIPAAVQVATTGHTRKLKTPVGTFDFLQLKPDMMTRGVQWSDSARPYRIATVEKALIDTFYISTRRKRRFARLPELLLDDAGFNERRYKELLKALRLPHPIAQAIRGKFEALAR